MYILFKKDIALFFLVCYNAMEGVMSVGDYLLVLLAVVLLAVNFVFTKFYQEHMGTGMRAGLWYNFYLGIFTALLMWGMNGFRFEYSNYSLLMAALMAVFVGAYTVLGFRIIAMGKVAVYTQFLMLGGMIVPYIFGIFYLGEEFSLLRLGGLVLLTVSVILSGSESGEGRQKSNTVLFLVLSMAVFFLNGGCSVTSKLHQLPQMKEMAISATAFVAYTGVLKAVISAILIPFFPKEKEESKQGGWGIAMLIILLSTAASALSYLFQLMGASGLPATVLYPMITGGTVVLTALAGLLCFREKLGKRETLGVILCFVATLMFL